MDFASDRCEQVWSASYLVAMWLQANFITSPCPVNYVQNYNELLEKIQNGLNELSREDMKLYYQTKEKIAAIQYKPRTFGDILCDTTSNIARGLEVLSAASNEPIQKSKFSE